MIIMAIDGASRRNGKPDCISAGAVFIEWEGRYAVKMVHEINSTNQRGELSAMVMALGTGLEMCRNGRGEEVYLVTDSEYIFNTLHKEWLMNWQMKGWITSSGEPVKNQDIWKVAFDYLQQYKNEGYEILPYHVKGHLVSVGKATGNKYFEADPTGLAVYNLARTKVDQAFAAKPEALENALVLFEKNLGYRPPMDVFRKMVLCNTTADVIAGYHADYMDQAVTNGK